MDTSFYAKEQFKAFKSMEANNQMASGVITSVQGKVIYMPCKMPAMLSSALRVLIFLLLLSIAYKYESMSTCI